MVIALLIAVFVLCQVLECALDYDAAKDDAPDTLWHRTLHKISDWLSEPEMTHNT